MTRARVALVLALVAAFAVLSTAALAAVRYLRDDEELRIRPAASHVLTDPASGASFEVPAHGWQIRGGDDRIFYGPDPRRPVAVVRGPAVFRDGYCQARPEGSYRGFAGFTRQPLGAWVEAVAGRGGVSTGVTHAEILLADGTAARLRWAVLTGGEGPCAATGIEVAQVRAGGVRVVLVADTGADDALEHDEIVRILASLRATAS